jgi:hypothetical protein
MDKGKTKQEKAEKVICIKGADKSALGTDSVITTKRSELTWNKGKNKKEGK